jgi:hypothetical protein
MASSSGRNNKRQVAGERRAQYLEDPEHQNVIWEDIVRELQKERNLVRKRKHSIESVFKREGLPRRWSTRTTRWEKRSEMQGELAFKGVFSVGFPASLLGGFPCDSGRATIM